jgi:hypothetical protein
VLEVHECGICGQWVASYGRWECERDCPLAAAAAVLEAELASIESTRSDE